MDQILTINIGDAANDGTGDDLRDAFIKVNNNFLYVGTRLGEAVDGANVGTGESVFKTTTGTILQFRRIAAGDNLSVSTVADSITLKFDPNTVVNFNGQDISNVTLLDASEITATYLTATGSLTTNDINASGTITGTLSGTVDGILSGIFIGDHIGSVYSLVDGTVMVDAETGVIRAPVEANVTGNVTGHVTGQIRTTAQDAYVDVSEMASRINTFDYGAIVPVFTDAYSYVFQVLGTDMGTYNNPAEFSIDAGTF